MVMAGVTESTRLFTRENWAPATWVKIGEALIQHMLCKQESGLTKILSHLPQYIFCRFENQRMRGNMFPFNPQVLYFKNM